jgi:hypothetical protein
MPTALEVNCAQSNGARLTNRPLLYFAVLATAQPIDYSVIARWGLFVCLVLGAHSVCCCSNVLLCSSRAKN